MTQKERQERSKREILRAAREEFGASSYENVSMEGICTRHGISKGMMYHYYANKDQLFLRCVEEVFNGLGSFLREECAGLVEKSGRECLKQYLLARERYFQKYPKEKIFLKMPCSIRQSSCGNKFSSCAAPSGSITAGFCSRL